MFKPGVALARSLRQSTARQLRRAWSSGPGASGSSPTPPSRLGALEAETEQGSKLFENVRLPAEAEAAATSSAGSSAQATVGAQAASGPGSRALSAVGNTLFAGSVAAGAYFGWYTYKYDVDAVTTMVEETQKPENSFPGSSLWVPVMNRYLELRRYCESEARKYADPPSEALLPDLPPHAKHVRTLVLDLDEVLVHSDWTRGRGWRTFKRPGVEAFLTALTDYFELVVYTSQLPTYADPILDRLDPERRIQYRLYRDSTRYVNGRHVRDLNTLNRDPRQTLLLTADADAFALQPDNAIKLAPWKLESNDTVLLDLLPFLEAVVRTGVPDVRDVVRSYEGTDIPTAFRERMARVQEEQESRKKSKGFLASFGKRS